MDPCRQVLGKGAQVDFQRTGLERETCESPVSDHRYGPFDLCLLGGYRARVLPGRHVSLPRLLPEFGSPPASGLSTRVVRLHCGRLESHFELVR